MSNNGPPNLEVNFASLPADPGERHEVLVDILGRYIFWLRARSVGATRQLTESEESREKLGSIRRKKYDELAALTEEQRTVAYEISEATVDRFIKLFLTVLSSKGVDQRLDSNHAIHFKLDIEIVRVDDAKVIDQETINRGGKKFFADYFGHWLNQFK